MVTTRQASVCAVFAATLLAAACTRSMPHQPPPTSTSSVAKGETTIRWIPNPAIDLMSPEGTFVRAAAESWDRVWSARSTGLDAVKERGYPGFAHAYNDFYPNIRDIGGASGDGGRIVSGAGTLYYEVVDLHREGDRYTADVCRYDSQTAAKRDNGLYISGGSHLDGSGTAGTYIFGPDPKITAVQQHSPLANQKGPARQPADNVFGTWVLFPLDERSGRAMMTDLYLRCQKLAPGTPADWPDPYIRPDPPPTLPNDPGWPDADSA